MMTKFSKDSINGQSKPKTSVQRGIVNKLIEQFPTLEVYLEDILPKTGFNLLKCANHINAIAVNKEILFFQERDGPFVPTLRLLHKYPFMCTKVQVDEGAIKRVMGGADIMCRGLTSPGGNLDNDFAPDTIVAIMAQDKELALGVGLAKLSRDDIRKVNDGKAIELACVLNDGLWNTPTTE